MVNLFVNMGIAVLISTYIINVFIHVNTQINVFDHKSKITIYNLHYILHKLEL